MANSKLSKLPLCPYCGGEVKIYRLGDKYTAICRGCSGSSRICNSESEAVRVWNEEVERYENMRMEHRS